eukprot:s1351_g6.t1
MCERQDSHLQILQILGLLKVCRAQCEMLSCQWFNGAGEVADVADSEAPAATKQHVPPSAAIEVFFLPDRLCWAPRGRGKEDFVEGGSLGLVTLAALMSHSRSLLRAGRHSVS